LSGVVDAGYLDVVVGVGLEQPWYRRPERDRRRCRDVVVVEGEQLEARGRSRDGEPEPHG
jgi:hypothetical protein